MKTPLCPGVEGPGPLCYRVEGQLPLSAFPISQKKPFPIPVDFSCLKQPCPSSSPLSKELDLHGFWINHFSIISVARLTTPCSLQC